MATSIPVVVKFAFDNFKSVDTKISAKCKHCSRVITEAKGITSFVSLISLFHLL